ncbi:MAG TPA: hypothetical protein PLY70_15245 [Saprospiraceae bacterium]|nr:hypothetical protein [Saprospiraceae bacterium]
MMKFNVLFLLMLGFASITLVSCGEDEPCDGKTCAAGEVLDALTCNCVSTLPCSGKTCAANEILNATTCQCVSSQACAGKTCGANQYLDAADCNCKNNPVVPVVVSGTISANTTWTADKIYELATKVYVLSGATLTIEPGTIIKGRAGIGSLATALVIAKGAKIIAEGTAAKPIIFTSIEDGIQPGQINSTLTKLDFGKWGGLIVLGMAPISATNGDTETQIEGIPGDVVFGKYGGNNPTDNSGVLKYVSVRFGGASIGDNNEINGITLGGVGSGTVVENIEIVANQDDGLEIFGGTVNVKNVIVAYQYDDALDFDMNYSGTVDNFYVIFGGSGTDEGLEIDGPEGTTNKDGLFTLKNGTIIATDQVVTSGADFKDAAQGTVQNVSWAGFKDGKNISIAAGFNADCTDLGTQAWAKAQEGKLIIKDCEVVSTTLTAASIANLYLRGGAASCLTAEKQGLLDAAVATLNNKVVATATVGANKTVFNGWTWTALNNELK